MSSVNHNGILLQTVALLSNDVTVTLMAASLFIDMIGTYQICCSNDLILSDKPWPLAVCRSSMSNSILVECGCKLAAGKAQLDARPTNIAQAAVRRGSGRGSRGGRSRGIRGRYGRGRGGRGRGDRGKDCRGYSCHFHAA